MKKRLLFKWGNIQSRIKLQEKGQSFVELAISFVFLMVLVAGVADLGRAFFTYIALRDSVQEGASFIAIEPLDCQGAIQRVREHTSAPINMSDPTIEVSITVDGYVCQPLAASSPPDNSICPGDDVHVKAVFKDFAIATPFLGTFLGTQKLTLEAEVFDSVLIDPDPATSPCP